MRHRSLRVRLLAIVLVGICLLALINGLLSEWGLVRVRNSAISDSAEVLEQRTQIYLLRMAQERAAGTDKTLRTAQHLAQATATYLAQTSDTSLPDAPPALQTTEAGWSFYHGKTSIVLPPNSDTEKLLGELAPSQALGMLWPELAESLSEIGRISYMMPSGAMRTYPHLTLSRLQQGWSVQTDTAYQAGLPANNGLRKAVWTGSHPAIDSLRQSNGAPADMVISAVAPVYYNREFRGVVVVDMKRNRLVENLVQVGAEQNGFAFLLDDQGRLVATNEEGQKQLLGQAPTTGDHQAIALDQITPALAPALAEMRSGRGGVTVVELGGRPHILAYAPVGAVKWSLGLGVPLDEVTSTAKQTAERITGIVSQTRTFGLLASLAAVVLLGLAMSFVLRRQFVRPLSQLSNATKAIAEGDLEPIAIRSDDEIGQLAQSFNTMSAALGASRAELTAANAQLEQKVRERTADLDMAVGRMEQLLGTQQELLRTLREVSTPIIPVIAGVLAAPLIGQMDDERAEHMTRDLLARIERERAHTVLLDITGVPVIDTQVAQSLLRAVSASRLLGADVVLVGVAPEVAQTIVTLGIDLGDLRTAADLRTAVEQLLARRPKASRAIIPV
jgi:anti-anti-sigma regulatory factor/HAMP domain-containing protein